MRKGSRPTDLYPGGWTKTPNQLMEDQDLTSSDKLVYIAIASWVHQKSDITYREITLRSGISTQRALRSSIVALAAAGYIGVEHRSGLPNRYALLPIPERDTVPQPPAPNALGASNAGGAPKARGGARREQGDPPRPTPPHKRSKTKESSSSETISQEQLAAGHRAVDQKINNGLAVMNRDALARKIALEDFDENGNPTTGNGSPTEPPKPAIDPQVEACSLCDFRGFRLEPWATADDPVPIVPTIRCDHSVASLEETS